MMFARGSMLSASVTLFGCSGYFGDLSERSDASCYPSCRGDDEVGFLVIRSYGAQPSRLDVQVCRMSKCDPAVRVAVRDGSLSPDPRVQGPFEYAAWVGGDFAAGTFAVQVGCIDCSPFAEGDVVDFTVDDPDGGGHWLTRATLGYVAVESVRKDESHVDRDCPDAARRTCRELRPTFQAVD